MKKENQTLDYVLEQKFEGQNVLIIGCPASGKSWIGQKLKEKGAAHQLIHTDNYMKYGYEQALYVMMEEMKAEENPLIIEGIQGYRLLRKGVQLESYYPDVVIEMIIPEAKMLEIYKDERDEKKIKYLRGFNKMHDKIINDYFALENPKPPRWIKVLNDW